MNLSRALFATLIWISFLYFAGMYLFTKGFLLTRVEIAEKSENECSSHAGTSGTESASNRGQEGASCKQPVRFKRAIVLLIDALRYDFALYNQSISLSDATPFQNRLPVIHEMVSKHPDQAVLFRSLADPPTTTLQRLKGIITGSLPTFVDAGQNFASFEISEDNIVDQLVRADKKVVFMGDDTWMNLFKDKFHKAFPFPSFNVKDLHTVDEGILTHLLPEVRRKDWDVIIAHFLGVDHCGHWLGPYHPSMAKKLSQMNTVIESVMQKLEEDTILFVLGDHGMTKTGDHGGDSLEERSAALFVYSSRQFIDFTDISGKKIPDTVSQIDFVPTLSLLLGVPIPFSSLGSIIAPLFSLAPSPADSESESLGLPAPLLKGFHRVEALRTNARQIDRYIKSYAEVAGEFPSDVHSGLRELFEETEKRFHHFTKLIDSGSLAAIIPGSLDEMEEDYKKYIVGIREMCHGVWAKFEMVYVYEGMLLVVLAIVASIVIVFMQQYADADQADAFLESLLQKILLWTGCALIGGIFLSATSLPRATTLVFIPAVASVVALLLHLVDEVSSIDTSKVWRSCTVSSLLQVLFVLSPLLLHSALLTSDSFVINEGRAVIFLVQSAILFPLLAYSLRRYDTFFADKPKGRSAFSFGKLIHGPNLRVILLGLAAMTCVRLSGVFVSCREEQYWCTPSNFLQSLSALPSELSDFRGHRYLLSIACIAALPSFLIYFLNRQGNLSGSTGQVHAIRYALPLASICICMYWGQQAIPLKMQEQTPPWQQVVFPQITYAMIVAAAITQWVWPLNLLIVRRTRSTNNTPSTNNAVRPTRGDQGEVTRRTNNSRHRDNSTATEESDSQHSNDRDVEGEPPPLVYGLANVFSASYLHVTVALALLIAVLNCDGVAPSVLLMVIEGLLYLEIYAGTRRKQLAPLRAMSNLYRIGFFRVPWYVTAGWSVMATQYFFATGHQATFTAIKFESAYTGFDGDFPRYLYIIPATLVSFNTFGAQIFFAATLPLILIWPFTRGLWATGQKVNSEEEQQGELNLHTYSAEATRALFQTCLMFLVFQACDLMGTMVAAAILRRHLMAWSVFAPRFIFQGVSFCLVTPTVLITFLFFTNIKRRLSRWVESIASD
ncbi:GPI ethanolamine phosphate transferase 3-like [Diadema antillarum]|uniref:GPI ethanolamine phosphate transferase 3-like n=1 Tax=Diadema antillarum TaxID=105358 RepID=UPI003A83C629